jgi:hypothetical protein
MNYERANGIRAQLGLPPITPPSNLGDKIAAVATPIARLFGSDCIDKQTGQLKLTSGCAKMKERLNAGMPFAEAFKLRMQGK